MKKRGASKWVAGDQVLAADLNDTIDAVSAFELQKIVTSSYTINPDTEKLIILRSGAAPIMPNPTSYTNSVVTIINTTNSTIVLNTTGGANWINVVHAGVITNTYDIWSCSQVANASSSCSRFYSDGTYWIPFP
jgi:hypothetical protein